jgi:3'-5' exoribonuclease
MTYLRSFDYTDEGKLLGHITIGVEMVHEKLSALPGFPQELAMLLKHMLLSHHGQYEFGSPKRPKTLEATILNYLDDLDSKINGIQSHLKKEPEGEQRWSAYHRLYDRYFYRDGYGPLAEAPEPKPTVQEPAPPAPEGSRGQRFGNSPFEKLKDANLDLF